MQHLIDNLCEMSRCFAWRTCLNERPIVYIKIPFESSPICIFEISYLPTYRPSQWYMNGAFHQYALVVGYGGQMLYIQIAHIG